MSNSLTTTEKAKRFDARKVRDKREAVDADQIGGMFWMGGASLATAGVSELLFTKFGRLRHFDKEAKVPTSPIVGGVLFVGGAALQSPIIAGAGLGPLTMWWGNWVAQQSWAQPAPETPGG